MHFPIESAAHILRGSKPVFWLEDTYTIIEDLINMDFALKPDFLLIADNEREAGAFLISRSKLLDHIENNKNMFEQLMFKGQETPTVFIYEHLLNHFPDPYNLDLTNQTLLGGVLQYGFTNASIYARAHHPTTSNEERDAIMSQQMETPIPPQAHEVENEEDVVHPPAYAAWDNPESLALREMQGNDCRRIQASIPQFEEDVELHVVTEFINDFMTRKW